MTWAPIPGWRGYYEASDEGLIRSLDRLSGTRTVRGRILKPSRNPKGYQIVVLARDGGRFAYPVHRLIAETFLGPMPEGMHTMHIDDDKEHNAASNLRYGTPSENERDKVRHGLNPNSNKTHCPQGHAYDAANTGRDRNGGRHCKTCKRESTARWRASKRAA